MKAKHTPIKQSGIVILGLLLLGVLIYPHGYTLYRQSLLNQCHQVHEKDNYHIHSTLTITHDGNSVVIPENVGVIGDTCVHPVHTHDTTGLIHVDYPRKIDFTLGDFFDVQGVILKDDQIGSVKKNDGYVIKVKVDGTDVNRGIRNIVLRDHRKIDISITSPKPGKPMHIPDH